MRMFCFYEIKLISICLCDLIYISIVCTFLPRIFKAFVFLEYFNDFTYLHLINISGAHVLVYTNPVLKRWWIEFYHAQNVQSSKDDKVIFSRLSHPNGNTMHTSLDPNINSDGDFPVVECCCHKQLVMEFRGCIIDCNMELSL